MLRRRLTSGFAVFLLPSPPPRSPPRGDGRPRPRLLRQPVRRHRGRRPRLRPRRRGRDELPRRRGPVRDDAVESRHRPHVRGRLQVRGRPAARVLDDPHLGSRLHRRAGLPVVPVSGTIGASPPPTGRTTSRPSSTRTRRRARLLRPHRRLGRQDRADRLDAGGRRPLHLPGGKAGHPAAERHRLHQRRRRRRGDHQRQHGLGLGQDGRVLRDGEPVLRLLPRHLRPPDHRVRDLEERLGPAGHRAGAG